MNVSLNLSNFKPWAMIGLVILLGFKTDQKLTPPILVFPLVPCGRADFRRLLADRKNHPALYDFTNRGGVSETNKATICENKGLSNDS